MRRVKREGEQRKTANIWWDPRTWDCVEQLETVRKSSATMLASARAQNRNCGDARAVTR